MALSAPVKAAALVLFIAGIVGATYGVEQLVGTTVEGQLVSVTPAHAERNATAGHTVTYLLSVHNKDTRTRDVTVRIDGATEGAGEPTTVRGNSTAGIFVSVPVPATLLPGEHKLDVIVESEGRVVRERAGLLTLRVLEPGIGFAPGDAADVAYLGRLSATGRVFNTNDPAVVGVAFPKTDTYRFSQGVLTVYSEPRPSIVEGLYQGMLGMQPGESRTVSFPPELGYGPAAEEERHLRDESLPRDLTLTNDPQRVPRQTFDAYINETRQGNPAAFAPGDVFVLNQNGNDWPYRVVSINGQMVEYQLAAEVGQRYTVYPFWPDASEILAINETHVTFRTTPTTEIGQPITMRAHWPTMSALHALNDTHMTVRHSPPVGFSYTQASQLGQPREGTVRSVNETEIVVAFPSQNPLAGKDLTFDVTLLAIER